MRKPHRVHCDGIDREARVISEGHTREARVNFMAAALLAEKLAKANDCDCASLLLTAALLEADAQEPPPPRRNPVAMCGPRIVVNGVFAGPRPEDL